MGGVFYNYVQVLAKFYKTRNYLFNLEGFFNSTKKKKTKAFMHIARFDKTKQIEIVRSSERNKTRLWVNEYWGR